MTRAISARSILIGLIANLIPQWGVLYWPWDTFQLLTLYWMEPAIIASWTILASLGSLSRTANAERRRCLATSAARMVCRLIRKDQDCGCGGGFDEPVWLRRSAMN
jgi:hypothetical protein